ncbi:MAG: adenosine deaminase [Acidobacteria bacterium]|nr:adenosine deaminase [Acidobacteriota bacterium]
MPKASRIVSVLLLVLTTSACTANAQTSAAERAFEAAKKNPPALRAFLYRMPKGGDLHMHLSGAVYAENFIDAAAHDLICIDKTKMAFVAAKASTRSMPPKPVCGDKLVPASAALHDQDLYDALVNNFSMRSWVPTPGFSGHDQFFATFDKFGAAGDLHTGRWLDEVAARAAAQNEQYLEIMNTPDLGIALQLAQAIHYTGDVAAARAAIKPGDLQRAVAADRAEFEAAEADRIARGECNSAHPKPQCNVQVRYLFQVLRAFTPEQVFTQTLIGFELAKQYPKVVGINFVQPEDSYASMSQYDMEMKMVGQLHTLYPDVHITLHAGELAFGMVPPEGLRFHIREAVEVAHAERIGHGVDIMYEDDADGLLREMAAKHIMVEINLTSNDVILGIKGANHPLASYRAAHVPFALSTDDEGVSRIDLTNEYMRAVLEQNLSYRDLKQSAHNSIEYSFLAPADKAAALRELDHRVRAFEAEFGSTKAGKR